MLCNGKKAILCHLTPTFVCLDLSWALKWDLHN